MNKQTKEYLKNRIEQRKEQIKLFENTIIKLFKDDIKLCENILKGYVGFDLKQLEKRTLKINEYVKQFITDR